MDSVKKRIKQHEGLRYTPYLDTENVWTVGYGRNLNVPFTDEEVDLMFDTDFERAWLGAATFPQYSALNAVRRSVVIEMVFQIGRSGVSRFRRFWAAVGASEWQLAHDEMLDSKWAAQTPERAKELAELFLKG